MSLLFVCCQAVEASFVGLPAFTLAVLHPLAPDAPSAAQDVLYTLLVLALAWTSISERKSMR